MTTDHAIVPLDNKARKKAGLQTLKCNAAPAGHKSEVEAAYLMTWKQRGGPRATTIVTAKRFACRSCAERFCAKHKLTIPEVLSDIATTTR